VSYEKLLWMSPDLQQKRMSADSRDERRNAYADVDSPGRGNAFSISRRIFHQ
jgi:hypothetical protein